MDNWSPSDISAFFWSLGPAAVGLFLIWFGQTKVAANREAGDDRIRRANFLAYVLCWGGGAAMLGAFVFIWIRPFLFSNQYIDGTLAHVPNNMAVSTADEDTASIFYLSERTRGRAPVRTFKFVIRDRDGGARQRPLQLSFSSQADEFVAGVELGKLGNNFLLREVVLAFQEGIENGQKYYLLKHEASKQEFRLQKATRVGFNDGARATKFADAGRSRSWVPTMLAAYAQSAPSMSWTRATMIPGLESASPKVRGVTIAELGDKVLTSRDYAATAEAVITRQEDGVTLRGRWSVYEALKTAILAQRSAAPRNGVLEPPVPPSLPLSTRALDQIFVDAVSGTSSANDAAKWLFRYAADRRLLDLLFRKVQDESGAEMKACYAAFAANVFYNWAIGVFLDAKDDKRQNAVSAADIKLIEAFHARVAALAPVAAASDSARSQFLIAEFGLGLLYAELSLLPAQRLGGAEMQSAAMRAKWTRQAKEQMKNFAEQLAPGSKIIEAYRYPFHRDVALAVAAGNGITAEALTAGDRKVNPNIPDISCKPGPV